MAATVEVLNTGCAAVTLLSAIPGNSADEVLSLDVDLSVAKQKPAEKKWVMR
jgi:type III secretory pathway lipoprotein EscJ